jgi:hypothetical protein
MVNFNSLRLAGGPAATLRTPAPRPFPLFD